MEPVPFIINGLNFLDSILEITIPTLFLTDLVILLALTYLFFRRVVFPQIRYISLPSDYFALLMIVGVAVSGILMRLYFKVDLEAVKELAMGVLSFSPSVPQDIGLPFYVHLFLVCALISYFPFSKMVHMGGIFLSPTRNLSSDNRAKRHINPWDYPVKVHTYEEYEDEFRDLMKDAGLPLEKE